VGHFNRTKALQDMYTTLTNRMQQNTAETNESQAILEAQVQQIAAGCNESHEILEAQVQQIAAGFHESLAILEDQVQRVTAGCNESHAILEDRARDQNTASEAKLIENTIISVMRELLPLIMAAHRSQDGPQEDIGKKQDKKGDRVAKKGRVGSGTRSSQKPKPTRQGGHRSGPESATPRAHNTRSGGRP